MADIIVGTQAANTIVTPNTGDATIFVDPSTKKLATKDDAGTVVNYGAGGSGGDHNDLTNIQGGTTAEYYHLTAQQHAVDIIQNSLTCEPTGFTNPAGVNIAYNSTTRKMTLTGTFKAYCMGVEVTELISGWESTAHPDVADHFYFLYHDGAGFAWSDNTFPGFNKLLIAVAYYRTNTPFGVRENHGFMPWESHQNSHFNIGCFRTAGADISGITLASTTAALRRPDISDCYISDEDCPTVNAALTTKLYSNRYITGTSTINYYLDAAEIVPVLTERPYYNEWTGSAFVQTLMPTDSVMTVWLYEVPTTSDTASQKIRHAFVQGQSITQAANASAGALIIARDTEKLKSPTELTLGIPSVVAAEYVCVQKFIIQYTASNWTITDSITITGSKSSQVGASSGTFLSAVSVGAGLSGNGTVGSPLINTLDTFLELTDTPDAYTSQTLKAVRVNAGETALEFYTPTVYGSGDVTGPAASVDSEIAVYSSTTGKVIKRATTTGILKGTAGVLSAASAGSDYLAPTGDGSGLTGITASQVGALATTAFVGVTKITVGTTEPTAPSTNDLWVDTN